MHKMIAASHNTPSLFSSTQLSNDIDRTNLTDSCALIDLCTIRKEHPRKTDMHTIEERETNLIDRSIGVSASLFFSSSSPLIIDLHQNRQKNETYFYANIDLRQNYKVQVDVKIEYQRSISMRIDALCFLIINGMHKYVDTLCFIINRSRDKRICTIPISFTCLI